MKEQAGRSGGDAVEEGMGSDVINDFNTLVHAITRIHNELAKQAVHAVNTSLTLRNWMIGMHIAEYELNGKDRGNYGDMTTNEAIAHFKLSDGSTCLTEYLYLYLLAFDYSRLGSTSSIATAVNSKTIRAMPILIPSASVIESFTSAVAPLFARIKGNLSKSRSLAAIRDALLPKLMSDEIRVNQ